MAKIRAEIHRTDDSVFVAVRNPNAVAPVTPIEQQYGDWTEIGEQMVSDMSVGLPTEPEPVQHSISPVDEARVYRINPDRKRQRIYTGAYTDDIDDRCRTYADLSGCNVELHTATDYKRFESANPKPPALAIPIGAESNTVAVYNDDTGETVWIGDRTPGFDCRCQRYAEAHDVSLKVMFDGGKLIQYFVPKSVRAEYGRQNAKRQAVRP